MTTQEILQETKKQNFLEECYKSPPSTLVKRCIFENIHLTIDEVDLYIVQREAQEKDVDRIWLLKKLAEGNVLDAPNHLIKKILK